MINNHFEKEMHMNKPAHRIKYERVTATIWQNEAENSVLYNVTLTRSYRDKKSDEFKDTHGFGQSDLLAAAKALSDAHTWIHQSRRNTSLKD